MFIIFIDNDKIIYKSLNKNPYCYKGIRVSFNVDYILELDDEYFLEDKKIRKIKIQYKHYEIYGKNLYNPIHVFVYENNKGIDDYKLYRNSNFLLTNNHKSIVINKDHYLDNLYLLIKNKIIKTNSHYLIINGKKESEKTLSNGDHIQYLGFSMYYYDDFLYINNFLVLNKLEYKNIKETAISYKNKNLQINQRFPEPVYNLEIEELKECDLPKEKDQKSILFQIGPSMTMSFAMLFIAIINVYTNYSGNTISSLLFIVMPFTMLISGVVWPLINSRNEVNKFNKSYEIAKKNYINYLNNYKNRQIVKIKEFKERLSADIVNFNNFDEKLFTYNRNNPSYLALFLGYQDIENSYIVNKTGDEEIDAELNDIENIINKITNVPLFINLNNVNKLTIITNDIYKDYYFNLFLLELSYKHHYRDVIIAIYKKSMEKIMNLPHMFINNTRLSLNTERQLQELNTVKTDKQIILFLYDKPTFKINNPVIKCIYVSSDEKDILNDTNTVVKYYSTYGYLINENKTKFNYFNSEYNFRYYFNLIEKYQNVNLISKVHEFKYRDKNYFIRQNYQSKQLSLTADFAYVNEELLSFDLHETKQGPHGLIGGATGSGKSELIISFILSLCIKYRPDYINIVLIDYKGSGIKDSLSCRNGTIPHVVASISNLEEDAFERLIIKIRNECKKRQLLFNKLSLLSSLSIVNIDDYLENNSSLENIAHLIIVVDEFAELKKEYPELMKELVSLSRIGRSLGVHLILSTQRPSGVIDDEIWSNSHFKIALKVNNEKDSQDLIKSKDAAYLTKAGEFYLQVDESLIKAKSIFSKNDISGNERIEVSTLDNCLNVDKKIIVNNPHPIIESNFIAENIINITKELLIVNKPLDFEKPQQKTITELGKKYKIERDDLVLGETDDYLNGKKNILTVSNKENIIIYSTRDNEIDNIINRLISSNRKMIIIGSNKYKGSLILDSILYEDSEDIEYLFSKLILYNKENITLIIEDYSCFLSYNEECQERIYRLFQRKDTITVNIIILSKKSNFNFKLLNSINNRYAIEIFDNQDLLNIYCKQSKYKGSSFYQDDVLIPFVPASISRYENSDECLNGFIKKIPNKISYSYIQNELLIGFSKSKRESICITDQEKLLIVSFSKTLIGFFQKLYINNANVTTRLYDSKISSQDYKHIIWVGGNRDKQTIFYDDYKFVIKDNEGIYIKDGKKEIIRMVDYE